MIDTENQDHAFEHVAGGLALEIKDETASCGVFIQPKTKTAKNVMVSIVEAGGSDPAKSVVSNSAVLTKETIPLSKQDVFPNSVGQRSVSVEASKLHRVCTVSVL